jgi:hypothetical protein
MDFGKLAIWYCVVHSRGLIYTYTRKESVWPASRFGKDIRNSFDALQINTAKSLLTSLYLTSNIRLYRFMFIKVYRQNKAPGKEGMCANGG